MADELRNINYLKLSGDRFYYGLYRGTAVVPMVIVRAINSTFLILDRKTFRIRRAKPTVQF